MISQMIVRPMVNWPALVNLSREILGDDPTTRLNSSVQDLGPSIAFWDLLAAQNASQAIRSCTLLDHLPLGFILSGDDRIIYAIFSEFFCVKRFEDLFLVLGPVSQWVALRKKKHKPMHQHVVNLVLQSLEGELRELFGS